MTNGLRHSVISFGHIISLVYPKEMPGLMRPLVAALQEGIMSYTEKGNAIDSWFQSMYQTAVSLSELVGGDEERPRVCGRQRNRENYPEESAAQHWKQTAAIPPFIDVICLELKSRFRKEKTDHYRLCALIPQEATEVLALVLHEKWRHLMPMPSSFESELFRWINHWK